MSICHYLGQISEVARQREVQLLRLVVCDDPGEHRVLVQVIKRATYKTEVKDNVQRDEYNDSSPQNLYCKRWEKQLIQCSIAILFRTILSRYSGAKYCDIYLLNIMIFMLFKCIRLL